MKRALYIALVAALVAPSCAPEPPDEPQGGARLEVFSEAMDQHDMAAYLLIFSELLREVPGQEPCYVGFLSRADGQLMDPPPAFIEALGAKVLPLSAVGLPAPSDAASESLLSAAAFQTAGVVCCVSVDWCAGHTEGEVTALWDTRRRGGKYRWWVRHDGGEWTLDTEYGHWTSWTRNLG